MIKGLWLAVLLMVAGAVEAVTCEVKVDRLLTYRDVKTGEILFGEPIGKGSCGAEIVISRMGEQCETVSVYVDSDVSKMLDERELKAKKGLWVSCNTLGYFRDAMGRWYFYEKKCHPTLELICAKGHRVTVRVKDGGR